jgi:hypothetical protein
MARRALQPRAAAARIRSTAGASLWPVCASERACVLASRAMVRGGRERAIESAVRDARGGCGGGVCVGGRGMRWCVPQYERRSVVAGAVAGERSAQRPRPVRPIPCHSAFPSAQRTAARAPRHAAHARRRRQARLAAPHCLHLTRLGVPGAAPAAAAERQKRRRSRSSSTHRRHGGAAAAPPAYFRGRADGRGWATVCGGDWRIGHTGDPAAHSLERAHARADARAAGPPPPLPPSPRLLPPTHPPSRPLTH